MSPRERPPVSDVVLVAFSLVLALVVWVIVRQRETLTETFFVAVVPREGTLHPSVEINGPPRPEAVGVQINFPKALERTFRNERMELLVDQGPLRRLAGVGDFGEVNLSASLEDVVLPPRASSARVVQFIDRRGEISSQATIGFSARLRTVSATIRPNIVGDPPHGFEVDWENVRVEPVQVHDVAVDRTRALRHQSEPLVLATEPVHPDPDPARRKAFYVVPFDDQDAGRYAEGIWAIPDRPIPRLDVRVPLREIQRTVTFDNIPFSYEPFSAGEFVAQVEPSSFSVRLSGPMRVVDQITPAMLRLRVDAWIEDRPGTNTDVKLDVDILPADEALRARLPEVRREVTPRSVTIRLLGPEEAPAPAEEPPTWDMPEFVPPRTTVSVEPEATPAPAPANLAVVERVASESKAAAPQRPSLRERFLLSLDAIRRGALPVPPAEEDTTFDLLEPTPTPATTPTPTPAPTPTPTPAPTATPSPTPAPTPAPTPTATPAPTPTPSPTPAPTPAPAATPPGDGQEPAQP